MTTAQQAFVKAWKAAERLSWEYGRLGRVNPDTSITVAVPNRTDYYYVRLGVDGSQGLTTAHNPYGVAATEDLLVKMRREAGTLVIHGNDISGGGGGGSPGEWDVGVHDLDGEYHAGTLSWAKVSKSGSALSDIATRPHSALSAIGPDDHHDEASAGNGIALSGTPVNGTIGQVISVDLAANPGLEFATGKLRVKAADGLTLDGDGLNVGAGTLITVGADTVGVTAGANYQFVGTGSGTAASWRDVSELAGAGLIAATGILAVGQGNGITVGADTVSLTTPGSLTVASQNDPVGNHTHLVDHSSNPGAAAKLLSSSNTGSLQLVTLANNGTFVSGFTGNGYRIDNGITEVGKTSAEFDNLTIRGRMRVYELLIQQIRATNGSVFVSSSSRAETLSDDRAWYVNGEPLEFNGEPAEFETAIWRFSTRDESVEDPETDEDHNLYHGFIENDLLRSQRWEMDSGGNFAQVRRTDLMVTRVHSLYEYSAIHVGGDEPEPGDDFVRLGNTTETTRQGSVYITADDSNAPYIDIVNDITSHADWNTAGKVKARVGRLTGITDSDFGGNLQGYGLYGNNVYLRGRMVVTGGKIGDDDAIVVNPSTGTTVIDGGKITTGIIRSTNWGMANGSEFVLNDGTFRLGGSSAPKLSWDGTNLSIVGSVTLTAPIPSGDVSGLGALATQNSVTTGQVTGLGALATLNNVSWDTQISGRPAELADGRVATAINSAGTVVTRVVPTATAAASAAGLYLAADRMGFYNGSAWRTYMDNSGNFYLSGSGSNGLSWNGATLTVNGTIQAGDGNLGQWVLTNAAIYRDTETNGIGMVATGTGAPLFYAGSLYADRLTAPFRVNGAGQLTATGVNVSGTITATAGTIGGWTASSTALVAGTGTNTVGLQTGSDPAIYAGSATPGSAPFRVTRGGVLTATGATLNSATVSGAITATSGGINGDLIVNGAVYSGKTTYASTSTGWWLGTDGGTTPRFHIGSSSAYMRWTGTALEINTATINAPYLSSAWTNATYNPASNWTTWGGGHQLRWVRMGEFVFVTGWAHNTSSASLTEEVATITKTLPAPDGSQFMAVRNGVPAVNDGGTAVGGYGDIVEIKTVSGAGHMVLLVNAGGGNINVQNIIINGWYKAAA